ncbi:MAG TPA: ABC transporter substrate-binding protein [Stackebrandtia sp.]|jgi:peptide/nickel transport system substrate-binding protein|uniref:ABC transporter substrate-binding protein n=1 Tax=Stackebrandtia sp. TaxID=2023065 RepID=UPI002D4B0A69|nr:ABC transporter substrate-binding protein [Stackebrandtia sp.]HZE39284.1 ABC transporter substrate-binding protein [Stackebrandtia sp.]
MKDIDLSRRRLFQAIGLGAAGAAGLGGLAACKADGAVKDKGGFDGGYPYIKKADGGSFNLSGFPYAPIPELFLTGLYMDILCLPSGYWYWDAKKWEYLLAESGELDKKSNTFTMKIRKNLKWSDGKPITADDYLTTFRLCWIRSNPMWASISDISAPDDHTITVKLHSPEAVIDRYILRTNVIASHATDGKGKKYSDFADEAADLIKAGKSQTSKEASALSKKLSDFRPSKLITSGPFTLEAKDYGASNLILTKAKNGFAADKIKFDHITVHWGETPQIEPLVENGSVDYASHGFSPQQEKKQRSLGLRIVRPPTYSGPALFFNFKEVPEFKDVRVRRAIAHAVNRKDAGYVALAKSGPAVKYMCGFSDIQVPDWLSDADQAKLDKYEHDTKKAEDLLKQAGWKKKGGKWTTKEGKPAKWTVKWPGDYADWSGAGESLVDQLNDFGFDLDHKDVESTTYNPEIDKGNWQLGIQTWGSSQHPHPHFAFVADLFTHNTPIAKNNGGDGMAFDLKVKTDAFGEVDLEELTNKAGQGLNEDEQKKNITKVALVFNELLPIVPICERLSNSPVKEGSDGRVKKFPAGDDPIYKNSPYADNPIAMAMLTGKLQPNK